MAFHLMQSQGVAYLFSDCLQSIHAFSTRLGGVSRLPHTSNLNLAFGRGDERGTVLENLKRFAGAVGFDPQAVVSVPQVHGNTVHTVDVRHCGMGYSIEATFEGDGYVTADPAVVPGVKTADCTPILLEASVGDRVVAVAALHAGWKGTVADIAGEGVRRLTALAKERAGVTGGEISVRAAIGPCIHVCCFEVREDCLSVVRASLGAMSEEHIRYESGKTYLDLPMLNRALLLRAGVAEEDVDVCPYCTACHTDLFYSHRASGGVRGTMLSVIRLP
ncbi:MAG: laccase domain-containing protein [Clostridia bacterium]|nr:laccase domain-containing protein [Clostridia bacterium]